ncbi:MAG: Uma2 family endonuclease [Planctomycetales bacterium]|nr:Uma2 family endonuclease [Planctomycetales bacterium]
MSISSKLTGADFDSMVDRGAFDVIGPRKVELIEGELRFMNPAGPIHDDFIMFLTRWSTDNTTATDAVICVQCGFVCDDDRPEPDIVWLKPKRYGRVRPTAADVLLLIEVSDSSLEADLREKADIYARSGVAEYWVVDIPASRIHVMSQSDGQHYRNIQIVVPPHPLAPQCRPAAHLNTAELFEVTKP